MQPKRHQHSNERQRKVPCFAIHFPRRLFVLLTVCLLTLTGCAKEQASLFEHDHAVPENWPNGLSDAVQKIKSQCESPDNPPLSLEKFTQMVGWIPEVAAESELTESEWNEVQKQCEPIVKSLEREGKLSEPNKVLLLSLASHLEQLESTLRNRQP